MHLTSLLHPHWRRPNLTRLVGRNTQTRTTYSPENVLLRKKEFAHVTRAFDALLLMCSVGFQLEMFTFYLR